MRKLTEFNEQQMALGFHGVLASYGIDSQVVEDDQGLSVWVLDDGNLAAARKLLHQFLENPELALPLAATRRPKRVNDEAKAPHNWPRRVIQVDKRQNLTFTLVGVCCVIFLAYTDPVWREYLNFLYYSEYHNHAFSEIRSGQVWRLITPALLHLGWTHIIFNMIWLYQLGTLIESISGSRRMLQLFLVSAAFSNTLQYVMAGPDFGGMSGVIYALLCYAWGMDRWEAGSRYFIDKGTFGFMIVWFVLCFAGVFGPVANYAHLGGLLVGLAWAYAEAKLSRYQMHKNR